MILCFFARRRWHTRAHTHTHRHTLTHTDTQTHTHKHNHAHAHTHTYIYTHRHTNTITHTHTHNTHTHAHTCVQVSVCQTTSAPWSCTVRKWRASRRLCWQSPLRRQCKQRWSRAYEPRCVQGRAAAHQQKVYSPAAYYCVCVCVCVCVSVCVCGSAGLVTPRRAYEPRYTCECAGQGRGSSTKSIFSRS